jgi:hypothetical protein
MEPQQREAERHDDEDEQAEQHELLPDAERHTPSSISPPRRHPEKIHPVPE